MRDINCWMSALNANVSAMAVAEWGGFHRRFQLPGAKRSRLRAEAVKTATDAGGMRDQESSCTAVDQDPNKHLC